MGCLFSAYPAVATSVGEAKERLVLKRLRGTPLDLFGKTAERKRERELIVEYETLVAELVAKLAPHNHMLAVSLARIPEEIRGYGHVKDRHLAAAKKKEAELLEKFRATQPAAPTPVSERVAA
jgi:indolepyruvate ferredoxin oxidoreductase